MTGIRSDPGGPAAAPAAGLVDRLERAAERAHALSLPLQQRLEQSIRRSATWSGEQRYGWRVLAVVVLLFILVSGNSRAAAMTTSFPILLGLALFLPLVVGPRSYAGILLGLALLAAWLAPSPEADLPMDFAIIGLAGAQLPLALALPAAAVAAAAYLLPAGLGSHTAQNASLFLATFAGTAALHQRRIARSRQLAMLAQLERSNRELRLAHEQLRLDSERAVQLAAAEERERIARELHDVLAHTLTVLVVQVGAVKRLAARDPARAQRQLDLVAQVARDGLAEVRRSVHALRSPDEEGVAALAALVEQFGARTEVACRFQAQPDLPPLPPALSKALYRLTQEALTNAVRHGNAAAVTVSLGQSGDNLRLLVRDDGLGAAAAPPVAGGGNGLPGAAERLRAFGGQVQARPLPDGGFAVEATVPAAALQLAAGLEPVEARPAADAEQERRP